MIKHLSILLLCLLLAGMAALPALADCPDGDSGDNVIHCDSNPGAENNDDSVEGHEGDDSITIEQGVELSGVQGNAGDDTLVNNGYLDGSLVGDGHYGSAPGNDSIVNNGHAYAISGDQGYGDESDDGDDTIINNGSVESTIMGDSTGNNGGNDLIVNNGYVGGDINGDNGYTPGGDDTIIINGSVGGQVSGDSYGDSANVGSGNDLIELRNGASGGDDRLLLIDGDGLGRFAPAVLGQRGGDDTLVFRFTASSQSEYDNLVDQFTAAVASTSATGAGTLTFRGQTFQWVNIEQLRNLIRLVLAESGGSGEVVLASRDARLNGMADPVAIYCAPDGGVHVYSIQNGAGVFLLGASASEIAAFIAAGGGEIYEGGGVLAASADGGLVFTLGGYQFAFSAAACGLAA